MFFSYKSGAYFGLVSIISIGLVFLYNQYSQYQAEQRRIADIQRCEMVKRDYFHFTRAYKKTMSYMRDIKEKEEYLRNSQYAVRRYIEEMNHSFVSDIDKGSSAICYSDDNNYDGFYSTLEKCADSFQEYASSNEGFVQAFCSDPDQAEHTSIEVSDTNQAILYIDDAIAYLEKAQIENSLAANRAVNKCYKNKTTELSEVMDCVIKELAP